MAFSGQTTVATNQAGTALENGDLSHRNPDSHKANSDSDISNLTTSQAGAASKKNDLAHRNPYNHKANSDSDSSNLTTRQVGTYYDPSTNLTWMRCSLGQTWNGTTCVGTAKKYTWDEARQAVAKMNRNGGYAGYTDWVLPDIKALKSLLRDHESPPKIDHTIFPNTPADFYWSASRDTDSNRAAWYMSFSLGVAGVSYKSANGHVRAVRAGR